MISNKVQKAALWLRSFEYVADNLEYVRYGSIKVSRILGTVGFYKYTWQGYPVTRSQAIRRLAKEL